MKTKPVRITATAAGSGRRDLVARIALAHTQAESARKAAKMAKMEFKHARKSHRAAKQAAKDARKQYKALKKELADAHAARQRRKVRTTAKPKAKRMPKAIVPATAIEPSVSVLAPAPESPSASSSS